MSKLDLRLERDGPRHYLDDEAVHCGDQLEIQLPPQVGSWLPVRYEASKDEDGLRVTLHAMGARILPDDATFRWPEAYRVRA